MDGQLFRVPQIRRTCKQTPGALDQRRDNLHLSVLYFCCLGQGLGTKVIRRVRSVSLSQRCIGRFWPWKWPRVCGRLWQATSIRCVTKGQSKSTTLSSGNHLLRRYNLAGQTEWQGLFNFSTFGKEVMALARYSSRPWMMRQIGTGISEGVGEMESEMKAALLCQLDESSFYIAHFANGWRFCTICPVVNRNRRPPNCRHPRSRYGLVSTVWWAQGQSVSSSDANDKPVEGAVSQ